MACKGCERRREIIVGLAKRAIEAIKPRPPVDERPKGDNAGRKLVKTGWQRRK